MSRKPTNPEYEEFRKEIREYLIKREVSMAQLAREIAFSTTVVSEFLAGTYKGSKEKVARQIEKWYALETSGGKGAAAQAYVSTSVAERMIALIKQTKRDQTVGLIHGPAGVGKSIAARAAGEMIAGVRYVQCTMGMRQPSTFARQLALEMGINAGRVLADNISAINKELRGAKALLIIDEASLLTWEAGLVVRDIHKGSGVGIVLIGTGNVEKLIDDRNGFYGQWSRLISYRYDILMEHQEGGTPLFSPTEVQRFCESMRLSLTSEAIKFAADLSNVIGWGGLGALEALLRTAELIREKARRGEEQHITVDHIRSAYRTTRGMQDLTRTEGRVRAASRKIA